MISNSTARFSDRVDDYVKYRPRYPESVLQFLKLNLGLNGQHTIVDVGSGTGISSEIFLKNGNIVYGIEPNAEMRLSAEKLLSDYKNFRSIDGKSDTTTLPDNCADFIVAAQAFHWFPMKETKNEFQRLLKGGGRIILIWNDRKTSESAFASEYEALLNRFGTDYKQVNHKNIDENRIREFLGSFEIHSFQNFQDLDFQGLLGRLTSSSYMPNTGHPRYEEMKSALKQLFDKHNVNGLVRIEYETKVYSSVNRPEFIKHYSEIQQRQEEAHYPGSQELLSIGSPFGRKFGLKNLGIHHELLPPGQRTSWPHAESNEEEFVYVIEGHPDAWIDGHLHRLNPGEGVGFPSGTGISHTFINNTEMDVSLLVVGESSKKENQIYYPLHPIRREQCLDSWWHSVPKPNLGPHDGLPEKLRSSQSLGLLNFTGEIIIESLKDQAVLERLEPYRIKSRKAEMPNESIKLWTINRYCIDEKFLKEIIPYLEKAIDEGGWYIHFYSDLDNQLFVIFRGKHFLISKRKDSSWEPMIKYGESIGVERRWTETIPVEFRV